MRIARSAIWLLVGVCLLIPLTVRGAADYESVLIEGVPHVKQKPDFCGEACAEMFLRKLGSKLDQDDVFDRSGVDPILGRGCYTRDLAKALRRISFVTGPVWYTVTAKSSAEGLAEQFAGLHADLASGVPSIVCTRYDERPKTTEHFRLVLGYDAQNDEVIYHEPAVANAGYRRMKRERLLKMWPLKYESQKWTVVRIRLEPGRLENPPNTIGFTNADYTQHIMKLKRKLPGDDFHIVIQPPFVVIGDESAETVRQRSVGTIKWASDRLKQDYFKKDPHAILDIWLFKDKKSYQTNAKGIFGDRPTTPFGYFSSHHGALVMNIATGGGTLVHEIVHPFMASNFPECPSWFNEGLASLYEQCGDRGGHIYGYTNWRLNGLQEAIRKKKVPPFKTLCSTTTHQFYSEDPGTNYSQARYLCYYLQERSLLVKYYHEFRRAAKDDPGGYDTLKKVLGEKDMAAFQKKWDASILKLRR